MVKTKKYSVKSKISNHMIIVISMISIIVIIMIGGFIAAKMRNSKNEKEQEKNK
jgi:flagellar basal body-associated protein FliL